MLVVKHERENASAHPWPQGRHPYMMHDWPQGFNDLQNRWLFKEVHKYSVVGKPAEVSK